jgi:hypothetical protein
VTTSDVRFGFDVGGVLIPTAASPFAASHVRDPRPRGEQIEEDTVILDYSRTPPTDAALAVLKRIVETLGPENVFGVSRAGPNTQRKTREWMQHWNFCQSTGFRSDNMHFCASRSDKGPICEKFGVTHYVDDRLEVLHWLSFTKSVKTFLLFKPSEREIQKTLARYKPTMAYTTIVSWDDIYKYVVGENADDRRTLEDLCT